MTNIATYLKLLVNRLNKLGERDVFIINGEPIDMPADSLKSIRQCKSHPSSFVGRYNKHVALQDLEYDLAERLNSKLG